MYETVRAWDLASTTTGDWTVGLKLGHHHTAGFDNAWIVLDIRRMRGRPDEVRSLFRTVVEADGPAFAQWLPQDPGQAGVDQVQSYVRATPGYRIECERMSGSKETRAHGVAAQVNIGSVGVLPAPWNAAFLDKLAAFPLGRYDDQVDALSLAFSKLENSSLAQWPRL